VSTGDRDAEVSNQFGLLLERERLFAWGELGDHVADQVVGRVAAAVPDITGDQVLQRHELPGGLCLGLGDRLGSIEPDQPLRACPDQRQVLAGDAKQNRDHVDRQRGGELTDQFDPAVAGERVDQRRGTVVDDRLQAPDRPGGQPGGVGRAPTAVELAVGAHMVHGRQVPCIELGDRCGMQVAGRAQAVCRGERHGIPQDRIGIIVAGDHPGPKTRRVEDRLIQAGWAAGLGWRGRCRSGWRAVG